MRPGDGSVRSQDGIRRIRLMRSDDPPSTERASAVTFLEGDRLTRRVSDPEPELRSAAASAQWIERMRCFLTVDPGGCRVAVEGDEVVGFAISQNRDDGRRAGARRRPPRSVLVHRASRCDPALPVGGLLTAPADAHGRHGGPRDPSRRHRPHGRGSGRLRVDGPARRRAPRRRARPRPRVHAADPASGRLPGNKGGRGCVWIDDRGRAVQLAAEQPETGQRLLWEALAASQGALRSTASPPPTSGPSTSAWRPASTSARRATSPSKAWTNRPRTWPAATSSDGVWRGPFPVADQGGPGRTAGGTSPVTGWAAPHPGVLVAWHRQPLRARRRLAEKQWPRTLLPHPQEGTCELDKTNTAGVRAVCRGW